MLRLIFTLLAALSLIGASAQTGPGDAVDFGGQNDYVQVPGFLNTVPTNEVTVEFWHKDKSGASKVQSAFSASALVNGSVFEAHVPYADGKVYWDFGNTNTGGRLIWTAPASIQAGWWHFALVASQSGNYMAIYTNGVLAATKVGMTPFLRTNMDLDIGWAANLANSSGLIDEFRIWSIARSAAGIQANMFNTGLSGSTPGLVAYWHFDDGSGTSASDATGHGNTGNLVNGPTWVQFPGIVFQSVSNITTTTATLTSGLSSFGQPTTVWFEWGTSPAPYQNTTALTNNSADFSAAVILSGLAPATTYHWHVAASNTVGVSYGTDQTFTTAVPPPTVTTLGASNTLGTNLTLNGAINPNGFATTGWFEWGSDTSYGHPTPISNLGNGSSQVLFSNVITTVENSLYHFRAAASNVAGISYGADATFMTPFSGPHYSEAYTFTTMAGLASSGSADGVGTEARFSQPCGVSVDNTGNVYVADFLNFTIRKVTPSGIVSTIAGMPGVFGSADGTNSTARFGTFNNGPAAVVVDSTGQHIYVADAGNNTIRMLTLVGTNWVVSTIAGLAGSAGSVDDFNSAARFNGPAAIALDSLGNLYVADFNNSTIRWVIGATTNWAVYTIAGGAGIIGLTNGSFSDARFANPDGIAVDNLGNLYVADTFNRVIRELVPADPTDYTFGGVVTNVAGGNSDGTKNGTNNTAGFGSMNVFAADRLAFPGQPYSGPEGLAVDAASRLYVADSVNNTIREVAPVGGTNWVVSTPLGSALAGPGSRDAAGNSARFDNPSAVAIGPGGNLYIADRFNNTIRKVTSAGLVTTLAGLSGSSGDTDARGSEARFNRPQGVAVDNAGNVYVADTVNQTIRQINYLGSVVTLAGSTTNSGSTDGVGSDARLNYPCGVAIDPGGGNLYIADTTNHTIRQITPTGIVTNIAGLAGNPGSIDGTNSGARFATPFGVAVDGATNIYVVDSGNYTIRRIQHIGGNWVVTNLAGLAGNPGSADGVGTVARFGNSLYGPPQGVAVDQAGNIYVADTGNATIRKITPAGSVTTIAGQAGNLGIADGIGTSAQFLSPRALAVDSATNIYVADYASCRIRKLTLVNTNWVVSTIGGLEKQLGSADGVGGLARFNRPSGIAVDGAGNLYIADTGNNTIRKGVFDQYGTNNPVPYIPAAMNGSLTVTLTPTNASGQWRFPWELAWHNSGDTVSNLAAPANYDIVFRTLPGWLAIPPGLQQFQVSAATNTFISTNVYYPTLVPSAANTSAGSLRVNLGTTPPTDAGWAFLGDATTNYLPSDFTTNLLPGTYLIGFKGPFSGRATPPNALVQVFAGQPTVYSVNYLAVSMPPGSVLLPEQVPPANISNVTQYPFGFNGQLQTDAGYGSGVAVLANVVLTAAHMVFDDQTLSYVNHAYWLFQQEQPQAAHGWHVLSSYSAQGTNSYAIQRTYDREGLGYQPDQSTAESRNLDVAALYFDHPVCGASAGYGGYLPSDTVPNPWLTGTSLKMLVGFPVDGSLFGATNITNGVMYQTEPKPYPLNIAPDQVNEKQEVYTASWFLSYPGNSGGPLYVQLNGYYYPAAVYLGNLYNGSAYQSVVRAIDSNVVSLITSAQATVDTGTNHTGGGVINFVPNQAISATNQAYVEVLLGPPAAVQAGAGWRLVGDPSYGNAPNYVVVVTNSSATIEFNTNVPGWDPPTNQTIQLTPGVITVISNVFYTRSATQTVSPGGNTIFSGYAGGPITPTSVNFSLTNPGEGTLSWTVIPSDNWIAISPAAGNLAGDSGTNLVASLNGIAYALAPGTYTNTLTFTNQSNGLGTTSRSIILNLSAHPAVTLTNVRLLSGDRIAMTLSGLNGSQYSILSSTNLTLPLAAWAEVLRLTNATGETTFTNTPTSSARFYRAWER
jgi:sugar lactone lactonase YvrE